MVIIIQCPDRVGLISSITSVLAKADFNIVSMQEHVDLDENKFFARLVVDGIKFPQNIERAIDKSIASGCRRQSKSFT